LSGRFKVINAMLSFSSKSIEDIQKDFHEITNSARWLSGI